MTTEILAGTEFAGLVSGEGVHEGIFEEGKTDTKLDDFLNQWKPNANESKVTPWLWVKRDEEKSGVKIIKDQDDKMESMTEEAQALSKQLAETCEAIDADETIPKRASKKNPRSKKVAREEASAETVEKLIKLAKDNGCMSGKWLLFSNGDFAGNVFNNIARAMIHGPLAETVCFAAKVATHPTDQQGMPQYVIQVYCPDAWDREAVGKVCRVMVEEYDLRVGAFKPDIYSYAGITSTHPSKMRSTLYQPKDFIDEKAAQEKRDSKKAKIAKRVDKDEDEEGGFVSASDDEEQPPKKKGKN